MTPLRDASPKPPPKYPAEFEASMVLPKQRGSPASSLSSLPFRRSNPSLHKLFESTTSLSGSRPSSGAATPTPSSTAAGSSFSTLGLRQDGTGTPSSLPPGVTDEHRLLIQRAFAPHVSVLADTETEEMIRGKGLEGGFLQLLRPFGDTVTGKVTVRDGIGASATYSDFGIRLVDSKPPEGTNEGDVAKIEELVERHLEYSEFNSDSMGANYAAQTEPSAEPSPFYTLYLRRLLSGMPLAPHETFAHPVASIIAVSSKNPDPKEEFRRLYESQREGNHRLPQWVESDYLRYYVLVHEEESGDIARANQAFDMMKRHFGLNCHLLRLKSQQCIPSDDDSVRLPTCEWMTAAEELAEIQQRETADDITDPAPYIFDSDVTAIRTFIREMVTHAVVPHMERHVALWNEQVLARRRGISGRFMSLSKRWAPFGSGRNSSSPTIGSANNNYDSIQGFYKPDAPEALMRKLADYSFMLRDWKLALSTYDILKTDFQNDKAWRHYAGAMEMAAISALMPNPPSSKTRAENIDEWIKAASYSYTDRLRNAAPYYALRSLALSLELLRLRGWQAADAAARWAARVVEMELVGEVGKALFTERASVCYAARPGLGGYRLGSRLRKAGFWSILAAQSWCEQGKARQADKCLDTAVRLYYSKTEAQKEALRLYGSKMGSKKTVPFETLPFPEMQSSMDNLRQRIITLKLHIQGYDNEEDDETPRPGQSLMVEEAETLDTSPRAHRKSLIGAGPTPIDVGPRSPTLERADEKDDMFQ